ncbi:MAG: hypothetical protein JKX84_03500 [Flavobacteriales bacterium]|nr:hypothetical protein [Flavobacteriales bacterium]
MFGIRQWFFSTVNNRYEHSSKLLFSGLYCAITFILVAYTAYAWSTSNAWDVGYHPSFSYNGMENLIDTTGWTVEKIAWVYLAPPLWGLMISVFSLIAYHLIDPIQTNLRTFLFWLSLNGFVLYFSYVLTGILSGQVYTSKFFTGFVGFYSWLKWSKGTIYGILVIQLFLSLLYSFLYSKPILQLNYSRLLASRKQGKLIIFLNVAFVPYLFGTLLIIMATFPMNLNYQSVRIIAFLLVLAACLLGIGFHRAKYISIVKGGLKPSGLLTLIFGVAALILLSRFLLSQSVKPLW